MPAGSSEPRVAGFQFATPPEATADPLKSGYRLSSAKKTRPALSRRWGNWRQVFVRQCRIPLIDCDRVAASAVASRCRLDGLGSKPWRSKEERRTEACIPSARSKTYPAPDADAGAGLSGAPPTETGPKGLGSRDVFLRDATWARAFACGMEAVVSGEPFCRDSSCVISEES